MAEETATQRIQAFAKEGRCPALIYLAAPDRIRKDRAVEFLLRKIAPSAGAPLRLHGQELTLLRVQNLRDEVRSGSLFSSQRYIVITNADAIPAPSLKALPAALGLLSEGVHIIFLAETIRKADPLVTFIKSQGEILELSALKGYDLKRWTKRELAQQGITTIPEAALERLILLAEESPDELVRFCERLALYVDGAEVLSEDLSALFAAQVDPNDFALAEALSQKSPAELALLLHELMTAGRAPLMLLALISKTYLTVLQIRVLHAQGLAPAQIRSQLEISPWQFQRQLPLAQRLPAPRIYQSAGNIIRAECKLKGKSLGSIDTFMELGSALRP